MFSISTKQVCTIASYRSKIPADRLVDGALEEHPALWVATVLPGDMNGPGDSGPTAAGQTIVDFVNGALPGVPDGHVAFVDARDVAAICLGALPVAERGERFLAAGRRMHLQEIVERLATITGRPAPSRVMPLWILAAVAALHEAWARLSGRPVLPSWSVYRSLGDEGPYGAFDSSPAQRRLGVTFRSPDATLRDAVAWLAAPGKLPPDPAAGAEAPATSTR